jgi:hypothetical protein
VSVDDLDDLHQRQSSVIARWQAVERRLTDNDIRRLCRRRDWVRLHPGVYVTHTGEPTWTQRAWGAVLFAWPAALCAESALEVVQGGQRGEGLIHVAVGRNRSLTAPRGVRLHRMAHLTERVMWNVGPPRVRYEDAVLDVAGGAATDAAAVAALAGAVQSRRTTAERILSALDARLRSRRGTWMRQVLRDIAAGACSVLEHGYLVHVERAHGLPRADRQGKEAATLGIVYRDATYDDLVVELDGRLFHDNARQRDRDLDRDLDAIVRGRVTVRLGYGQVFDRPCATAARVAALLTQRGWTGHPQPCGPDCALRVVWQALGDSQPTRKDAAG